MENKPIDLTEFNKLEEMLKNAGIEYEREDNVNGTPDFKWEFHQLRCPEMTMPGEKWLWDVICNTGSYGYQSGLLELWGRNISEPEGWLRAEECFEKIKEILKDYERSREEKKS